MNLFKPVLILALFFTFTRLDSVLEASTAEEAIGQPAFNFSLTAQNGEPLQLSDLQGKVVFTTYIFTRCPMPTMCPLLTNKMLQLQSALNKKFSGRVAFVSFTFDPKYDTPEVLAEYAESYNIDQSNWYLLTGDEEQIKLSGQQVGMIYENRGDGDLTHNMRSTVIDATGVIQKVYTGGGWRIENVLAQMSSLLPPAQTSEV